MYRFGSMMNKYVSGGNTMIYEIVGSRPEIHESVFLAPTSSVMGRVRIGERSSVWFGSVLRGDTEDIVIGKETNIQDLSVIHADPGAPAIIGDRVTVGHRCIIHGCIIEDDCLIGMGAIVMNRSRIGKGSVIAAGSVILENTEIPPYSLVAGIPGKVKRTLYPGSEKETNRAAMHYVEKAGHYVRELKGI